MPDFTTHVLFGELLLSRMPQEMREEALAAGAAYFWGAQGPDPLFYAGGLKGDNALRKLGGQMHRRHPQQLLEELVRSARDASPEEKPLLKAYALGFLAHYCLDRQVHPYVYFLVERRKRALFDAFVTLDAMKAATVEQLAAVPAMTRPAAEAVYAHFHSEDAPPEDAPPAPAQ